MRWSNSILSLVAVCVIAAPASSQCVNGACASPSFNVASLPHSTITLACQGADDMVTVNGYITKTTGLRRVYTVETAGTYEFRIDHNYVQQRRTVTVELGQSYTVLADLPDKCEGAACKGNCGCNGLGGCAACQAKATEYREITERELANLKKADWLYAVDADGFIRLFDKNTMKKSASGKWVKK